MKGPTSTGSTSIGIECSDPWGRPTLTLVRELEGEVRYTCPKGVQAREYPYGLYQCKLNAFRSDCIVVVEGPFDAIAGACFGYPTVACLGSKPSTAQTFWVSRYVRRAILCLDNDRQGELSYPEARDRLVKWELQVAKFPRMPWKDLSEAWSNRASLPDWESLVSRSFDSPISGNMPRWS